MQNINNIVSLADNKRKIKYAIQKKYAFELYTGMGASDERGTATNSHNMQYTHAH